MTPSQTQMATADVTSDPTPGRGGADSCVDDSLGRRAERLLESIGIGDDFAFLPLEGGANNRVFRVDSTREPVVLKDYFRCADEPRDRLAAEFSFLTFAWAHGVRCVPRPLGRDAVQGLALYELIAGRRIGPREIGAAAVDQAIEFFLAIDHHKHDAAAAALPCAAESCFTLGEHLDCVQRRIDRLLDVEADEDSVREAASFVRADLRAAWLRVSRIARRDATRLGWPLDEPIASVDRCISPSDFGFHNALVDEAGRLRFIDFEYAGWDDPAKLVCDFFCQPAVPVPHEHFGRFAEAIAADLTEPQRHARRFRLLLPVYQIKWCCILLNDFLPDGGRRRQFALPASRQAERRQQQLNKARAALASVA